MSNYTLKISALITLSLTAPMAAAHIVGGTELVSSTTPTTQRFTVTASDGWKFQGELTLPRGARAGQTFPTVFLIHGSGANDMNETVPEAEARFPGGSANFLTIAKRLNAQGFAVARFNKRGVTGLGPQTIPQEQMLGVGYTPTGITQDAWTVLQYVRRIPGVDARQLFVLGHSEGTDIASQIAATHPELIRGVIAIGVSGESSKTSLRLQIVENQVGNAQRFDRNKDGLLSDEEINTVTQEQRVWLPLWEAMGLLTSTEGKYQLVPALDKKGQRTVDIKNDLAPFLATYFDRTYPNFLFMGPTFGAYLRDAEMFGYTTTILPKYNGPVLLMNGDKDDQTPLRGAVAAYEAVKGSGNADVTLNVYPGTGHTLAPLRNGVTTLGPMSEQALLDLTSWLKARVK